MCPYPFSFLLLAAAGPTPIQCYDWDRTFVLAFHAALGIATLASFALLILFLFRPLGWTTARPYLRVVVSSVLFVLTVVPTVSPFLLGLWPGLSSVLRVKPEYVNCAGIDFEAAGFLGGLFGAGASAISQPITMALISLVGWGLYILLLWAVTAILGRIRWPRALKGHLQT